MTAGTLSPDGAEMVHEVQFPTQGLLVSAARTPNRHSPPTERSTPDLVSIPLEDLLVELKPSPR